jgi:hypothetical protein
MVGTTVVVVVVVAVVVEDTIMVGEGDVVVTLGMIGSIRMVRRRRGLKEIVTIVEGMAIGLGCALNRAKFAMTPLIMSPGALRTLG